MTAPIASGWSGCRVGLAPTGKRRLCTAQTWFRFVNKIKYLADARKARQNIRANIFSSVCTEIEMQDYQSPVPVIDRSGGSGARDSPSPAKTFIWSLPATPVAPMPSTFEFCLPTMAAAVPDHPVWLHEVKYDGYRRDADATDVKRQHDRNH
jgi:hypothetical protein